MDRLRADGLRVMAKLDFDAQFFDAWIRADSDPDAAASALLIVAARLRERVELTSAIVDFLAGAIEASMHRPQKSRGKALLRELKLASANRRTVKADWVEVGKAFAMLKGPGASQNSVASQVAADFNISESTATQMWKHYLKANNENDRINNENVENE
jgi:hypothetical protein